MGWAAELQPKACADGDETCSVEAHPVSGDSMIQKKVFPHKPVLEEDSFASGPGDEDDTSKDGIVAELSVSENTKSNDSENEPVEKTKKKKGKKQKKEKKEKKSRKTVLSEVFPNNPVLDEESLADGPGDEDGIVAELSVSENTKSNDSENEPVEKTKKKKA